MHAAALTYNSCSVVSYEIAPTEDHLTMFLVWAEVKDLSGYFPLVSDKTIVVL